MSNTVIVGIDPGHGGALAFIEGRTLLAAYKMPTVRQERSGGRFKTFVDEDRLIALLRLHDPSTAFVEDVFSSSQMGVVSAFSFGEGKGILKGALRALDVALHYVSPAVWKRDMGVSAAKQSSIVRARGLFPFQTKLLSSEGKCEAALIALYGLMTSSQFKNIEPAI